jgi:hypothetical protein
MFLHKLTGTETNVLAEPLLKPGADLVQVVVLAACEPRGHRFEWWPLHIAQCVGKTSR